MSHLPTPSTPASLDTPSVSAHPEATILPPPFMHQAPIGERIHWLFGLAERHGHTFRSPDAWLARQHYQAQHPTAIAALKCMDGRINLSVATQTPAGILMPFRNLGGMFNLGWPHLGEILTQHVQHMVSEGRRVLLLITYHWSKGELKRGCAGFKYNRQASMDHTQDIRAQVSSLFGASHQTVYPLVCGFETDTEALLLHNDTGHTLDMAQACDWTPQRLEAELVALLPHMPAAMRADLLPLLLGNAAHVRQVRLHMAQRERELDIEHREWVICLGRGFDFLHTPNLALIVGPYSPDLAHPIQTAAFIIQSNMDAGRIPNDGFLLLASVPYEEMGVERARAELKSRFMAQFAADVITQAYPRLAAKMHRCTAVLDWQSRALDVLERHTP